MSTKTLAFGLSAFLLLGNPDRKVLPPSIDLKNLPTFQEERDLNTNAVVLMSMEEENALLKRNSHLNPMHANLFDKKTLAGIE